MKKPEKAQKKSEKRDEKWPGQELSMACQHLAAHLKQLTPPQLLALAVAATKSAVLSSALHANATRWGFKPSAAG